MAAKDDTINAPIVSTGGVLQAPAQGVAGALQLPTIAEIAAGKASPEVYRRLAIREELLKAARENFDDIVGTAETRYSRDLADLTTSINAYLKREPGQNAAAIYLDPAKFDAAMALGFEQTAAIGRVLKRQGLILDPEIINDMGSMMALGEAVGEKYQSRFGINIYTHGAGAYPDVGEKTPTSVILPAPDHANTIPIPGMTRKEDKDFINKHEGWHAKDSKYTVKDMQGLPDDFQDKIRGFNPEILAESAPLRAAYVSRHRDEILADVGALGDMIRGGKDPKIIDPVYDWRKNSPEDDRHMSLQVLDGLLLEIRKMGLGNFRKLGDRAAKQLYYDIVEEYGIDEAALKAAAEYKLATGDEAKLAAMREEAKLNPAVAKGVAFAGMVGAAGPYSDDNPLKPGEDAIKDALAKWDPMKELQERAMKDSGRITPATMVKAHAAIADDLATAMEADPDNHLLDLKRSKLKTALLENVQELDYVEANKRFGVDIVATEPALDKFKPAVKTVTRPTGPKAGG